MSAAPAAPRLGITIPLAGRALGEHGVLLERIEAQGLTDIFTQETEGFDVLTPLGYAAAATRHVRLGSAIASVFTRGPVLLAMQAASLAEAAPERFVHGDVAACRRGRARFRAAGVSTPLVSLMRRRGALEDVLAGLARPG